MPSRATVAGSAIGQEWRSGASTLGIIEICFSVGEQFAERK
jgi:hypothetical protein